MGNFRAYPGRKLIALRDQPGIIKGETYQLINVRWFFTFVGVDGTFEATGKDWDPLNEKTKEDISSRDNKAQGFRFWWNK